MEFAFVAPAAYEEDLRAGTPEIRWHGQPVAVEPLPWYLPYIQVARQFGVPPWELIDGWSSRRFWADAMMLVTAAEGAASKQREARAEHAAMRA